MAAVAGAVIAIGLAVVLLGDDATASRADYQATVVNTRDRVDFAYARIAKSQSIDELIERMDEASAVIGKTASDLDDAGVAEGFEDTNATLVTRLRGVLERARTRRRSSSGTRPSAPRSAASTA